MVKWKPNTWRNKQIAQQPDWDDKIGLEMVFDRISSYPPLVFSGEINNLKNKLKKAEQGKLFMLQGGDCAETFSDFNDNLIYNKLNLLASMSIILGYNCSKRTINIGRIAGQFAKPRTNLLETKNNISLPNYRGDSVNDIRFNDEGRRPDVNRIIKAYNQSAATLNLIRAYIDGGGTNIFQSFLEQNEHNKIIDKRYISIINKLEKTKDTMLRFSAENKLNRFFTNEFFTSHEGLLLEYEEALTRKNNIDNKWYNCSSHTIWIGNRTRDMNGAHVEFAAGIQNPIGIKLGPDLQTEELIHLINRINPNNESGKLILIARFGIEHIEKKLDKMIHAVKKNNKKVLWICDPMHGNTIIKNNYKTRIYSDVINELQCFFKIHKSNGTIPGGIHIEYSSEHVTECIGGPDNINEQDLPNNYKTACDPRLNINQCIDLIFKVSELIKKTNQKMSDIRI